MPSSTWPVERARLADITDYPRVLALSQDVQDALARDGSGIPPWLELGWIWSESGGVVGAHDSSIASLGGELGLGQLSQDERGWTGYTDTGRLTSKTELAYQLDALNALIGYIGSTIVAPAGVDPTSDLYWMLIKYGHGGGESAMRIALQNYVSQNGGPPPDWSTFYDFALDNVPGGVTQAHVQKYIDKTDSVRLNGLALQSAAGIANAVTAVIPTNSTVGLVIGIGLVGYALYYAFKS
jgi:hypothetical protein